MTLRGRADTFWAAMRIFRHYNGLPDVARGSVVAIGNFDGVHRGHLAVIGEAGRIARSANVPWSVLTFEPHPRSVFAPESDSFRLTPFRAKARLIASLGVDNLIVLRFDRAFSRLTAETFIADVLVAGLRARHVVSGYDFVFGHSRKGNSELLLREGADAGFDFTALAPATDAGGDVHSATRVRMCLIDGDARGAARILGRAFEIEGRVGHGEKRGQTIGYPTANLSLDGYLRPATGVYAVHAGLCADGDRGEPDRWYDGVANLGRRPTFAGNDLVLEAHLFAFQGTLYGRRLRVAFIERLREEKKFDGITQLKAQIAEDCARAAEILARRDIGPPV